MERRRLALGPALGPAARAVSAAPHLASHAGRITRPQRRERHAPGRRRAAGTGPGRGGVWCGGGGARGRGALGGGAAAAARGGGGAAAQVGGLLRGAGECPGCAGALRGWPLLLPPPSRGEAAARGALRRGAGGQCGAPLTLCLCECRSVRRRGRRSSRGRLPAPGPAWWTPAAPRRPTQVSLLRASWPACWWRACNAACGLALVAPAVAVGCRRCVLRGVVVAVAVPCRRAAHPEVHADLHAGRLLLPQFHPGALALLALPTPLAQPSLASPATAQDVNLRAKLVKRGALWSAGEVQAAGLKWRLLSSAHGAALLLRLCGRAQGLEERVDVQRDTHPWAARVTGYGRPPALRPDHADALRVQLRVQVRAARSQSRSRAFLACWCFHYGPLSGPVAQRRHRGCLWCVVPCGGGGWVWRRRCGTWARRWA